MRSIAIWIALEAFELVHGIDVSYNGQALTPAMGWDNWNSFGCDVSEDLLLGTARKIVTLGLKDLGYNYVILDDCWSNGRYENGSVRPDFNKFPNGMKHVGNAIHDLGLKFGMYSSAGYYTCGRYAGSLGHEDVDAQDFADFGVDYLKYDNCYNGGQAGTQDLSYKRYNVMSQALNKTGRPILYGLCNWGEDSPWNWAQTMSNSWRMSGDITDSFSRPDPRCPCDGDNAFNCALPGFHCSVLNIMNKMSFIVSKTQVGAQSDMDMLEIGNGGMDDDEYKTHMSIWALNASPLIMGTDIRKLTPESLSIYSNPAVLAINQDPAVGAGQRHWRFYVDDKDEYGQGEISLWTRVMNNTDVVVAFVNGGNSSREMNTSLAEIWHDWGGLRSDKAKTEYDVYDLWGNRMTNELATNILNGTAPGISNMNETSRWNITEMSYADGLKANATALFGTKVETVEPLGTFKAQVQRHGIGFFRFRSTGKMLRRRDEL